MGKDIRLADQILNVIRTKNDTPPAAAASCSTAAHTWS
jgi:hypothetical protein